MILREQTVTAARLSANLARIAVDAVAEPVGGALPLSPARLAQPRALTTLLRRYGLGYAAQADVTRAALQDIPSVSSNCNNVVLSIEQTDSTLPSTLFAKLPSTELLTRAFCNLLRVWRIECRFYGSLAPLVPIRVPHAYAVAARGSRFILLLENLHADRSVQLFTNRDLVGGATLEQARRCLATLAKLHGAFWGRSTAEREALLPGALHPFFSARSRPINLAINSLALESCRKMAPRELPASAVDLYRRAMRRWDTLVRWWSREPLTLMHGDSHLANFFSAGDAMGMLDWQATQWGKGMRDVQYLLINSLPTEVLEENERDLLQHYLSELERHGITLSEKDAWEQYRAHSFQTLMTSVVSLGLGALTEKEDVMRTLLRRSVAAVERLGFAAWLDELNRSEPALRG